MYGSSLVSRIGNTSWEVMDTYTLISRFFSSSSEISALRPYLSRHGYLVRRQLCDGKGIGLFSRSGANGSLYGNGSERVPGRRSFHDYFTTHLPGKSVRFSASAAPSSESHDTVVRIPLRSAKQHFGVTRSRGNRPRNEDWYQAGVIDLPPLTPLPKSALADSSVFYFGVFDGHGSEDCSAFLRDYLHGYIEESARIFAGSREQKVALQTQLVAAWKDTVGGYFRRFRPDYEGRGEAGEVEAVLTYAFLRADMDFITRVKPAFFAGDGVKTGEEPPNARPTPYKGGSTASIALISTLTQAPFWDPKTPATLISAHIGDTRILLSSVSTGLALPLTTNHHPSSPTESRRLRRYATAFVSDSFGEERFGVLANTRSFGDVSQKRLGVSAEPEVYRRELEPSEHAFMVLVSDGISGTLTDQEIVDIVKECNTPEGGAKELVEFAEEVTGEGDNTTAMVVRLGGWEKRTDGGEGFMGTKDLRAWRRDEALSSSRARRM